MPTKPIVAIQTSNTQAKQRKIVTLRDTHKSARFSDGRPWWGFAEMPAERGMPWGLVGTLTPGNHEQPFEDAWESPWLPDAKWLRPNVERGTVEILYVGMIAEYTAATRAYYDECAKVANENKWVAPSFGGPVDSRFRAVVGRDLPQSPKIPQAAMAGDPWLLGFTTEVNETLFRLVRSTTFGSGTQVIEEGVPVDAVSMTPTDLAALVAAEVAKAMAALPAQGVKHPVDGRSRAAKEAKRTSQAQAQAA